MLLHNQISRILSLLVRLIHLPEVAGLLVAAQEVVDKAAVHKAVVDKAVVEAGLVVAVLSKPQALARIIRNPSSYSRNPILCYENYDSFRE